MNNVKESLQQYKNVIQEFITELPESIKDHKINEISTSAIFSERAASFLNKFNNRKYDRLVKLSNIKLNTLPSSS